MGTGSVSAELLAKYQHLSPEVEPNDTLIPRKLRYAAPAGQVMDLQYRAIDKVAASQSSVAACASIKWSSLTDSMGLVRDRLELVLV